MDKDKIIEMFRTKDIPTMALALQMMDKMRLKEFHDLLANGSVETAFAMTACFFKFGKPIYMILKSHTMKYWIDKAANKPQAGEKSKNLRLRKLKSYLSPYPFDKKFEILRFLSITQQELDGLK